MIAKCRVRGKRFDVLWPHLWRYKRDTGHGIGWLCTWKCLREYDRKKEAGEEMNSQEEIARELVAAMEKGADPIEFLKGKGYGNPGKAYDNIKYRCRDKLPELYEKFPKRRGEKKKLPEPEDLTAEDRMRFDDRQITKKMIDEAQKETKVTLAYDPSIAEEYRREQALKAEAEDLVIPEEDFWTFTAISNEELGEFYYDRKYKTIDWRHPAGEEISLPPKDWAKLARKIPMILKALGVSEK